MNRKLQFLSLALVILLGVGVYLWLFGRPAAPSENPLKKTPIDKMSKIVIKNVYGTTRLEKQNDQWRMVSPVKDLVDPTVPADIINALQRFTLGSIVSENPSHYAEFQLDAPQATHVEVYLEGKPNPSFAGFIGKTGTYNNCYFRFDVSSGPVYIANNLSEYQFRREPDTMRLTSLLNLPEAEPTHVRLTSGKQVWDISRSSHTWKTTSGAVIEKGMSDALISNLRALSADGFAPDQTPPAQTGLAAPATPYVVLSVDTDNKPVVLTVGKVAPEKFAHAPVTRYAQATNRPVIFTTQEIPFKTLIELFAKLPK
jgi:hypothetical protein